MPRQLGQGGPFTDGDVVDFSSISSGVLKGAGIYIGLTERGMPLVPRFCRNEKDFTKYFGGTISQSDFPYMMLRILKKGVPCWIIPLFQYTDVTDAASVIGVKATATLTVGSNASVFTAKEVGAWANAKLKVTIVAAASGLAATVDLKVELAGYPQLTQVYNDLPNAPTADEKTLANSMLQLIDIGVITTLIPVGNVTLATGSKGMSPVAVDVVGNSTVKNGMYMADNIYDAVRICTPFISLSAVDDALSAYVNDRKDMLHFMSTPVGATAQGCLDYRNRTGAFSGVAIDSWRSALWTGGLKTTDIITRIQKSHTAIAHIMMQHSIKDATTSSNFSASGLNRGVIDDADDVVVDFGSASNQTDFGNLYNVGVNCVTKKYDADRGGNVIMLNGNKTLWKKKQKLQKLNIAEYMVWLYRAIQPKVDYKQFDPNDPIMWAALFNSIKPILEESKGSKMRAIYDYKYIGDQFATEATADQVKFNDLDDLDAGIYKFRVLVKPIGAAEWIGYEIGVTNTGINFEDIITA
jgi:hypothetical protein